MSQLNVDNIQNRTGSTGGPNFPSGITVAVGQTAYIHGNLQVDGTETIVNTETLNIADKTVGIGSTSNASNTTADGAGIEVFASSSQTGNNKTITWQNSSSAWTFGGGGIVATDAVVGSAVTINSSGIKAGIITASSGVKVTGGGIDITGNIGLGGATYGSSGQVLTSGGSGANATWTTISAAPEFAGIASGSITAGKGVCVADDGKLMGVTGFNGLRGTQTLLQNNNNYHDIVYSTASDKFVVFYRDEGDGNKGKARVVTQGTGAAKGTLSVGAAVEFTAASPLRIRALYDSTNDKVVVLYADGSNSNRGSVCVGTISGTSITFGTPVQSVTGLEAGGGGAMEYNSFCYLPDTDNYAVVYNSSSGNKGWCRIGKYSATNSSTWPNDSVVFCDDQARETGCWYDSTADKLVIAFNYGGDSNHGYVIAGTVSGDDVSVGTRQEYDASNSDLIPDGCHDPDTGKSIIVYSGGSNHGSARALTLSGTTFTFGSVYKFCLDSTNYPKIAYDSAGSKKFLITYSPYRSSQQWGESIIATLTGDVITYGTKYEFSSDTATASTNPSLVYSPDSQSFVALYRGTDTSPGGAEYFIENIRSSNLTAGNYVGIANASYTNGQTASTALPGAVNTVVSGLVVGSKYYVVGDGSLNSTADTENIDAGNAIAANKLLVR
tara:strand:- start:695 stop:2695 length:2001 start_codon:yes stop_codon:yes gene_type:complete